MSECEQFSPRSGMNRKRMDVDVARKTHTRAPQ